MTKQSKYLVAVTAILILLNCITLFTLFKRERPPRHPEPKEIIIKRLGLNAKQQEAYEAMIEIHHATMQRLQAESRELHRNYYTLLKEENVNTDMQHQLSQQIALNQQRLDSLNFSHFKEIRNLCDTKQKQAFDEMIDHLGEMFEKRPPEPKP